MVKFTSRATGDLVMVQAHARALLKALGKSDERGIIEVADMPVVLATLRALPDDRDEAARSVASADVAAQADEDEGEGGGPRTLPFSEERVSLRKRAVPLIRMIEQAQAEGKPIVWGV